MMLAKERRRGGDWGENGVRGKMQRERNQRRALSSVALTALPQKNVQIGRKPKEKNDVKRCIVVLKLYLSAD